MADIITNMKGSDEEAPRIAMSSPSLKAFDILLLRFTEMTSAEIRIETGGLDVLGLQLLYELNAAERSREELIEATFDVIAAPDLSPEDRGLRRMACLLTSLLQKQDDAASKRLHAQTYRHRDVFDIPATSPAARRAQEMQKDFFAQFDDLASLREYGGEGLAREVQADIPELLPA